MNAMLLADFYKLSHRNMYPKGTQVVYSTWTPRTSMVSGVISVVSFGQQAFIKKYLIDFFNINFFSKNKEEVVSEYKRIVSNTLGVKDLDTKHIEDLHSLGYLPLEIKSIQEGTRVPIRTPMMTIKNTDERFFWLTNYIETLASCELWQASTSATLANEYRKILDKYAMDTVGDTSFVQFQGHDFSMRGMSSLSSAITSGMGHLLSFVGTDTIPAIEGLEQYYRADVTRELVGTSIPATEHSVQCCFGNDIEYFKNIISKVHPSGFVSIVSDGYDFWKVIGEVLPSLKEVIMNRDGKVVIRPDSGDPVKIVCGDENGTTDLERKGAVQALWDIFGGATSPKGYKILDSHIGLIYGDAITIERAKAISEGLKQKGFASINCVYGIGSYTYQFNTRDTFGFALKTTYAKINNEEKMIYKDPKTDNGIKKSQKGMVVVMEDLSFRDELTEKQEKEIGDNLLVPIFINGKLIIEDSLSNIRGKLNG